MSENLLSIFPLSFTVLFPTALGYTVVHFLFPGKSLPAGLSCALSYGIGCGILSLLMLLWGDLGILYTFENVVFPFLGILSVLATISFFKRTKSRPGLTPPSSSWDLWSVLFLLVIGYYCVFVFWHALSFPVLAWDAFSTHGLKAKVLFWEKGLALLAGTPHHENPLHIPLLQVWASTVAGSWYEQGNKLFFPVYFVTFLTIQHYFLRRFTQRPWALFGCFLLVSANLVTSHATALLRDFPLMFTNCVAVMLLLLWNKDEADGWLILAGLFSASGITVKIEGLAYAFIHFLLVCFLLYGKKGLSLREKFKKVSKFIIPVLGIALFQYFSLTRNMLKTKEVYNYLSYSTVKFAISPREILQRIPRVLSRYKETLFFSGNWNLAWALLFLSLWRPKKKAWRKEAKALLVCLGLFLGIFFVGFTFTQYFIWLDKGYSVLSRSILHYFPLVPLLIILINGPAVSKKNNKGKA